MKRDCRKTIGHVGEKLATIYLKGKGMVILHRNWSTRLGELDIIAKEGDTVVFVEVRTTTGTRFGYGFQSVDYRKQQKVRRLSLQYVQHHRLESNPMRFDVVSVLLHKNQELDGIQYIRGAF